MSFSEPLIISLTLIFPVTLTWIFYATITIPPPTIGVYNLCDVVCLLLFLFMLTIFQSYGWSWLVFGLMILPATSITYKMLTSLSLTSLTAFSLASLTSIWTILSYLLWPNYSEITHLMIWTILLAGLANIWVQGGMKTKALWIYGGLILLLPFLTPDLPKNTLLAPFISTENIDITIHIPLWVSAISIAIKRKSRAQIT